MNRRTFQSLMLGCAASGGIAQAQSAAPRIKIGQIGTRHAHAAGQLAALRWCESFEVVGLVEPDEGRRAKVASDEAYAGLPWMTKEQLLNTPGLQAVCVETDVAGLLDAAENAVKAGMHVHIDKPAGESFPQFQRIHTMAAEKKKKLIKMGYMFRYNPAFQLMIRAVREGWLGEVFSIHGEMSKLLGNDERAPMRRYAGGSMFELGCHLIDSVVRVVGKPERVTPHIRRSKEDGFADNMLAVLDYPKTNVTVRSSLIEPDGGSRRQFIVCGTKGSVEIRPLEPPAMKLTLVEAREGYRKGTQEVKFDKAPRYAADWEDFAKAIRGEVPWEYNAAHDLAVQETVLLASGLPLD